MNFPSTESICDARFICLTNTSYICAFNDSDGNRYVYVTVSADGGC